MTEGVQRKKLLPTAQARVGVPVMSRLPPLQVVQFWHRNTQRQVSDVTDVCESVVSVGPVYAVGWT